MALIIDYDKIDAKYRNTVKNIESKPHVRYIRYLLSKRWSPTAIRTELQRLGLSSPHEPAITAYYLCVMDPVAKKLGLAYLYADYKNRLLKTNNKSGSFAKEILNYRLHLGNDLDGQVKLCKYMVALDIEELWMREVYKFHGTASSLPVDENGNRILSTTTSYKRSIDTILLSEKRYLIDKFILENVPNTRIAEYCREKLKLNIRDYDIEVYKRIFFNIQTQSIEEKIEALEREKNNLDTLLDDINNGIGDFEDMSIGEKSTLMKQTEQRLEDLSDNIKTLNMMYSDFAFKVAEANHNDFEQMFADVVTRAYKRFSQLDNYKDRDVVDPLFKTARMMSFAHDKVESIRLTSKSGGATNSDRHSQGVIMELYKKRIDEINNEQKSDAAIRIGDNESFGDVSADDIEGIDELGISFETKDED